MIPRVSLGEVLREVDTSVPSSQLDEVNLAGVYSFGRGLFRRGPMLPSKTSYSSYNRLVAGDYVISMPKAWEGALALVTPEFHGWFLSPVFPTFRPDPERLLPTYLSWFCKQSTVWTKLQKKSRGLGARRETVSPLDFLALEIPLPALQEQERIVNKIDSLVTRVESAISIVEDNLRDGNDLLRSILANDLSQNLTAMGELVELRSPDVVVEPNLQYQFAGVYSFGRGLFRASQKAGAEFSYKRLTRIRHNEFLYPKLMAWEGAFGVVPENCDGCVVSPEFPVFKVHEDKILPDVLDVYFRTPSVWPKVAGDSTGTNVRRRRLNPKDFLNFRMPVPSHETQKIVRGARQKLDKLRVQQEENRMALSGMVPAILDRAFNGQF